MVKREEPAWRSKPACVIDSFNLAVPLALTCFAYSLPPSSKFFLEAHVRLGSNCKACESPQSRPARKKIDGAVILGLIHGRLLEREGLHSVLSTCKTSEGGGLLMVAAGARGGGGGGGGA